METRNDDVTATPRLGKYTLDTKSSTIAFRSRHMFGLFPVTGTFAVRSGTADVTEPVGDSSVRVEIDAKSFDTGNERRDGDVKSAKFLDAEKHPVITFASEKVEGMAVTGTLSACGVDRKVVLAVTGTEVSDDRFTVRATVRVDRTEFGVTASPGMAGRYLDLTLDATFVRA